MRTIFIIRIPEFFNMFNFEWLNGSRGNFTEESQQRRTHTGYRRKIFWKLERMPWVKPSTLNSKTLYIVTGILKNIPANSDFPLAYRGALLRPQQYPYRTQPERLGQHIWRLLYIYVLPPGLSVQNFNAALKAFAKKHKPAEYSKTVIFFNP